MNLCTRLSNVNKSKSGLLPNTYRIHTVWGKERDREDMGLPTTERESMELVAKVEYL